MWNDDGKSSQVHKKQTNQLIKPQFSNPSNNKNITDFFMYEKCECFSSANHVTGSQQTAHSLQKRSLTLTEQVHH